jgi:hypothetical protein
MHSPAAQALSMFQSILQNDWDDSCLLRCFANITENWDIKIKKIYLDIKLKFVKIQNIGLYK